MERLASLFGQELTKGRIEAYWSVLGEMDERTFLASCERCMAEETFFPVPAVILKQARTLAIDTSAAQDAWDAVHRSVAHWLPGTPWQFDVDAPTRAGLDAIGGAKRLVDLDSDDAVFVRKEFIAGYESAQQREVDERLRLGMGAAGRLLLSPEVHDNDRK
jgi:hypothetical protein